MEKEIKPTIGCKQENLFKYLIFNKKPKNEIDFGFSNKKYLRYYYKCKLCGHLTAKHKKYFFDKLYEDLYFESTYKTLTELNKTINKIKKLPSFKSDNYHRIKRIKKRIRLTFKKEKVDILDVGSGIGIFPIKMINTKFNISAIEPGKISASFIKMKSKSKIKVINGDFLEIKINKLKKYNLITFNKVLEHVEKPRAFLNKSLKLLKDKNLIYVEVPDANAIHDKKEGKEREEFGLGHHHVFTIKSLRNIFELSKIKLICIDRIREPSGKYTLYAFGMKK